MLARLFNHDTDELAGSLGPMKPLYYFPPLWWTGIFTVDIFRAYDLHTSYDGEARPQCTLYICFK